MMKHTRLNLFIVIIFMVIGSLGIHAQTMLTIGDDEVLVYVKWMDGQKTYIAQTGDNVFTYALEDGECTVLSPDGKYLLQSTENADTLKIFDFSTMELLYQQEWNSTWETCYFGWFEDNIISFYETNVGSVNFKFEDLSFTEILLSPPPQPIYPQLPNWFPNIVENFLLPSPNPNIFLYERCPSGISDSTNEIVCSEATEMVIYDVSNNQVIEVLETDYDYLRGYMPDEFSGTKKDIVSNRLVSWSTDARYLAFCACRFDFQLQALGNIRIFNLESNEYISLQINNPNIWRDLEWSDENILTIWKSGGFNDEYPLVQHDYINHFVFVYVEDEISVLSQDVFYAWQANSHNDVLFAPDSHAIVILGYILTPLSDVPVLGSPRLGNLILVDTITGESTVIDTDVTEIITWRTLDEGEEWGE